MMSAAMQLAICIERKTKFDKEVGSSQPPKLAGLLLLGRDVSVCEQSAVRLHLHKEKNGSRARHGDGHGMASVQAPTTPGVSETVALPGKRALLPRPGPSSSVSKTLPSSESPTWACGSWQPSSTNTEQRKTCDISAAANRLCLLPVLRVASSCCRSSALGRATLVQGRASRQAAVTTASELSKLLKSSSKHRQQLVNSRTFGFRSFWQKDKRTKTLTGGGLGTQLGMPAGDSRTSSYPFQLNSERDVKAPGHPSAGREGCTRDELVSRSPGAHAGGAMLLKSSPYVRASSMHSLVKRCHS